MSRARAVFRWLLFLPAALCWLLVAYLAWIEVLDVLRGEETEHSPLIVLLYLLPVALVLTWWPWRCAGLSSRACADGERRHTGHAAGADAPGPACAVMASPTRRRGR